MLTELARAFRSLGVDDLEPQESTWLIHFTSRDAAARIAAEGFARGTPLKGALLHTSGVHHHEPGVNFAFAANDEYAIMVMPGMDFGQGVEAAVMFQAPSLRMPHADGFHQCAFWGPDAQGPFRTLSLVDDATEQEPHQRRWRLDATGDEGDLFDVMAQAEALPSTRRRGPGPAR